MSNKVIYPIAFCVLAIYFYCLFKYSIDFPFMDDYDSSFLFIDRYIKFGTISKQISLLFLFFNEHIILLTNLITIFQYRFLGSIDLRLFCYIGGLGSFIIGYLYYLNIRQNKLFSLSLIIVILITFLPIAYITNWAMSAVQNLYILVFTFATFHLLQYKTLKTTVFSAICQFFATFTVGSGFISFFVGLLLIKSHKRLHQGIWIIIGLMNISLFFYLFLNHPHSKPTPSLGLESIPNIALYGFYFLGSSLNSITNNDILIISFGVILSFLFLQHFLSKKKIFELSPIEAFLIFLILNVGVAAAARSHGGYLQAGAHRYQPVFHNILLCLSILFLNKNWKFNIKRPTIQGGILTLFVLFYISRLVLNLDAIDKRHQTIISSIIGFECGDYSKVLYHDRLKETRGKLYKQLRNVGYVKKNYSLDKLINTKIDHKQFDNYQTINNDNYEFHLDKINGERVQDSLIVPCKVLELSGWAINETQEKSAENMYLILDSDFYSSEYGIRRKGVSNKYQNPSYLESGFHTQISLENIPTGFYSLKFCTINHKDKTKQVIKEITLYWNEQEKIKQALNTNSDIPENILPFKQLSTIKANTSYGLNINNQKAPPKKGAIIIEKNILNITGWALDKYAEKLASGVYILIDNQPFLANYGYARPDVAKFHNNPTYTPCGFSLNIPTAKIGKGEHVVEIRVVRTDKKSIYASDKKIKILIK